MLLGNTLLIKKSLILFLIYTKFKTISFALIKLCKIKVSSQVIFVTQK